MSTFFRTSQLLKENDLTIDSIETLQVDDPGKAGEAFISGAVNAAVTWEPNLSQIAASGKGKILETSKSKPGIIVDVLVVDTCIYNTRKEDLRTFVNGWLQAVNYIKTNTREADSIMAKELNIPGNDFPTMAAGLIFADKKMNEEWLKSNNGAKAKELFDQASKIWSEEGLIRAPKQNATLITGEFIP